MSNLTDFFPVSGGGGGILKQHIFTASGTFDLTTLGIADGDTIGLFLVGGGSGGDSNQEAGSGGNVWSGSVTLGTAGTVTVTIGNGGSAGGSQRGGETKIENGGIPTAIFTGYSAINRVDPLPGSPGWVPGGYGGSSGSAITYRSSGGVNGFGMSGSGDFGASTTPPNIGRGGNSGSGNQAAGGSGIIILYYS